MVLNFFIRIQEKCIRVQKELVTFLSWILWS